MEMKELSYLYIGGSPEDEVTFIPEMGDGFIGCIGQVYIDGVEKTLHNALRSVSVQLSDHCRSIKFMSCAFVQILY